MNTFSQTSMLDVAYNILDQNNDKMNLNDLIDKVFAELNIEDPNCDIRTELYLEIMTSGKFVYLGHEEWDLKCKKSLKEYTKDAIDFLDKDELVQTTDEPTLDDLAYEDDEYSSDSYDDEDEDSQDNERTFDRDGYGHDYDDDDESYDDMDDYDEDDDFNQDKYDEYMDEYEDMYE